MKKENAHSLLFWVIAVFLMIRVILNFQMRALPIFFIVANGFFLILLFHKQKIFSTLFVLWMAIDSMIGTYLATAQGFFGIMYFGTMGVNLIIMVLVLANPKKIFR